MAAGNIEERPELEIRGTFDAKLARIVLASKGGSARRSPPAQLAAAADFTVNSLASKAGAKALNETGFRPRIRSRLAGVGGLRCAYPSDEGCGRPASFEKR